MRLGGFTRTSPAQTAAIADFACQIGEDSGGGRPETERVIDRRKEGREGGMVGGGSE